MSTGAVVTMLGGMVAIWGGLLASVVLTLTRSKARSRARSQRPPSG